MSLVANAGPLIALARIGRLSLLPEAFSQILVPMAVFREVTHDPLLPGAQELGEASWLVAVSVADRDGIIRLRLWLDRGESEAIVLAGDRGLPLAIDERRGRRIAESLGVATTGTIGILLASKRLGLIEEVTPLVDQLLQEGVRLSRSLQRSIRRLAGEG
ncbi:MAG: DUF3368 domain-containing protein [Acidobacteria bacterium]|nr:DUF3368 domain-containing protein [Acidobacteriota bacterium]